MIRLNGALRRYRGDESGITIVELMLAMVILGITMMGVALTVMNSLNVSRSNANRVVAANLAASEIEQLLTRTFSELEDMIGETDIGPVDVDGRSFDVTRDIYWSTNDADVGPCISSTGTAADENVLRIDVSVSWTRRIGVQPVVSSTTVSPPVDTFDSVGGTIAVYVADDDNQPMAGVSTRLYGPVETSATTSIVVTTNEFGCAVFENLDIGTYDTIISRSTPSPGNPYVDIDQRRSPFPLPATYGGVPDGSITELVGVGPRSRVTAEFFYAQGHGITVAAEGWDGGTVPAADYTWHYADSRGEYVGGSLGETAYAYPADYTLWAGTCSASDPRATYQDGDDQIPRWPDASRDSVYAGTAGGNSSAVVTFGTFDVTWDSEVLPSPGREVTLRAELTTGDCTEQGSQIIDLGTTTVGSDPLRYALPWGTWRVSAIEGGVTISTELVELDPRVQEGQPPAAVLTAPTPPLPGPMEVNGPVLWLDASENMSLTAADGRILEWRDRNVAEVSATQAAAGSQPTYVGPAIKGRNVVRFDGETEFLDFDGDALVGTDYTAFVVNRRLAGGDEQFYLGGTSTVPNNNLVLGYATDDTLRHSHIGGAQSVDSTVDGYLSDEPARVHTFAMSDSGGMRTYQDGELIGSGASTSTLESFGGAQLGRVLAGGDARYFRGDIAEVVLYPRLLTDAERASVEAYLIDKWVEAPAVFGGPSDLPGLRLWLDSSQTSTMHRNTTCNQQVSSGANNSRVRCWQDRSGNGNHARQTGADSTRPTALNLNSGSAVVGFGESQFLTYDGRFLANTNYTVTVVSRRTEHRTGENYLLGGANNGPAHRNLHLGYRNNTTLAHAHYSNDSDATVAGYTNGEPMRITTFRFDSAVGKHSFLNGVRAGTQETPAGRTPLTSNDNAQIGRYLANSFRGEIAEIVMYDRALSDAERVALENHLSTKWGLS